MRIIVLESIRYCSVCGHEAGAIGPQPVTHFVCSVCNAITEVRAEMTMAQCPKCQVFSIAMGCRYCPNCGMRHDKVDEPIVMPDAVSTARPIVNLSEVTQVLQVITTLPGLRADRKPGDMEGQFDKWFDGGAVRYVTGFTIYQLNNGTEILIPTFITLMATITFPTGAKIGIEQLSLDIQ